MTEHASVELEQTQVEPKQASVEPEHASVVTEYLVTEYLCPVSGAALGQTWTALDEIGAGKPEVNPVPERNAGCTARDEPDEAPTNCTGLAQIARLGPALCLKNRY